MAGEIRQLLIVIPINLFAIFHFWKSDQSALCYFFCICVVLLLAFTLLIQKMQKNAHPSAGELMARTLTFWWMLALLSLAFVLNSIVMCALLCVGSLISLAEYQALSHNKKVSIIEILSSSQFLFMGLACILSYYFLFDRNETLHLFWTLIFVGILLPSYYVLRSQKINTQSLPYFSLGYIFFGALLPLAYSLYILDLNAFLMAIFLTEIRDLISYWLGKFTKNISLPGNFMNRLLEAKVAAAVSPQKTWAVGILSTVIIFLIGLSLMQTLFPLQKPGWAPIFWMGFVIGIFGLIGDLIFSLIKRLQQQKDSGTWLPGNSGIIDRIDALVFTLPMIYLLLRIF